MLVGGRSLVRSIAARIRVFESYVLRPQLLVPWENLNSLSPSRKVSSCRITKNIELFVHDDKSDLLSRQEAASSDEGVKGVKAAAAAAATKQEALEERILLVIFKWLMSKPKHIMKFADLYMEQGFDVVTISMVASDLLLFLMESEHYRKILLHGFSVGGYVWGEALNLIEHDRKQYNGIVERIVGQIWDSIADVTEVPIGTSRSLFPNTLWLQNLVRKSLEYHMHIFHEQSTRYYLEASRSFHRSIVRAPALLFMSKADPVGSLANNLKLRDKWESLGIETQMKIFEASPHVGHYRMHPKEYLKELYTFLNKLGLLSREGKFKERL